MNGAILIDGKGGTGTGIENNGITIGKPASVVSTGTGSDAATLTLMGTGGSGKSGQLRH